MEIIIEKPNEFFNNKILDIIEYRSIKSVCDYGCVTGERLIMVKRQILLPTEIDKN